MIFVFRFTKIGEKLEAFIFDNDFSVVKNEEDDDHATLQDRRKEIAISF